MISKGGNLVSVQKHAKMCFAALTSSPNHDLYKDDGCSDDTQDIWLIDWFIYCVWHTRYLIDWLIYLLCLTHKIFDWLIYLLCLTHKIFDWLIDWFIVFNANFSIISAISWWPVLVVEETGVPGENHRPWASNW